MRKLLVLVALGSAVLAGCGGATTPYAAIVNGERIPASVLEDELDAIANNEAFVGDARSQIVTGNEDSAYAAPFVAQVLNERVIFQVIGDSLRERGIAVTPEDRQLAEEEIRAGGAASAEQGGPDAAAVAAGFPADYRETRVRRLAELNALRRAGLPPAELACVRHVLVANVEEARAVRERLVAGEDFAAVAREVSRDDGRIDPASPRPPEQEVAGSAAEGGSLGCLGEAETANFVPEFRRAIDTLPLGELSSPVETEFGAHLIEVTERRPAPEPTSDEEREQSEQERLVGFLRRELLGADVTVNPRYGRFEPAPQGSPFPSVVPNEPPSDATSGGSAGEGGVDADEAPADEGE